ncbi:MAG: L,D-transpeptidase family protein [Actinobacteria bacterium]|nr:L,D-transpeptidase family protein [Actinomycetota bacterium]
MTPRNLGRLILGTSWLAAVTVGCASAASATSPVAQSAPVSRPASGLGPQPDNPLVRPANQPSPVTADPLPDWAAPLLASNVPASAGQAVIVTAPSTSSTTNTVSLWTRTATGWQQTGPLMPGHNGDEGWSAHRKAGDLTTPTGTYTLTAAGGVLPNPGTREPYEHSASYFHTGGRFLGHNTAGVFDYVVAIDFNRVAGSEVSSEDEPNGQAEGDDIWLHVDNGAPTLGCVTVAKADMVTILRWLDPSQHPVIVLSAG